MLRNQLVCGINDSHIQHRLLSEQDLTLEMAMQIALGREPVTQKAKTLQGGGEASASTTGDILKFTRTKPSASIQQIPLYTCCEKPGHHPSKCRLKMLCHRCSKVGHIKLACLAQKMYRQNCKNQMENVKTVQESAEQHSVEHYCLRLVWI